MKESKTDKKRKKLLDRIGALEVFIASNLHKKQSTTSEINLPKLTTELAGLRKELDNL